MDDGTLEGALERTLFIDVMLETEVMLSTLNLMEEKLISSSSIHPDAPVKDAGNLVHHH